ncbi:hypothetical protein EGW08_000253 [Elysia chlorotica]|uniref:Uncharacterized protein n=1 Tax=Elysia chlorotica TaxID=188477 RepID=A0A3S1BYK3_ELYCH|nr:hypothetical protein EGW08_000253 [Elysia chlorotica]
MGGATRRLGQGRLSRLSHEQQTAEKLLFRQQTQMLNRMIQSDRHYLPFYKRTWSPPVHTRPGLAHVTSALDSSALVLARPSSRKPVSIFSEDGKNKPKPLRVSSTAEESQIATRLKNSRCHGPRLHCEVLGQETCHKCVRILDQAAIANCCPICLSSRKIPLSLSEFAFRDSLDEQRNVLSRCQTGSSLHSSIEIFNRIREKDVTKKNARTTQGKQPLAIMFTDEDKRSNSPSKSVPHPNLRSDSEDWFEPAENFSPRSFEFKVQVTFGNNTELKCI